MRRRALWIAAMGLVLAGCSTTVVTGVPAEKVLTKAELYDPCTLPVAALQATGLNPKPVDTDFAGVPDPEWHLCMWKAASFFITVLSTTHTYREVVENPRNEELRHITVANRKAVTYVDVSDPSRDVCDVAFATEAGVVITRAAANASKPKVEDPCDVAHASAAALNDEFPK